MSKRTNSEDLLDQPPRKKSVPNISFEPVSFGTIHSLEVLDIKVLQLQNKRLFDRLEERRKLEDSFRSRIEQLEQRQTRDDELFCIVNRYWNQLDEDIRLMLERFDGESVLLEEDKKSPAADSFLKQLSTWDKEEVDDRLRQRVEFSTRAVAKLIGAFDRLLLRNATLRKAVIIRKKIIVEDMGDELKEEKDEPTSNHNNLGLKEENDLDLSTMKSSPKSDHSGADDNNTDIDISDVVKNELQVLHSENDNLHQLNTSLQEKIHKIGMQLLTLEEQLQLNEESTAEWRNKHDELEYYVEKADQKIRRLEKQLAESVEEIRALRETVGEQQHGDVADEGKETEAGSVAKSKFKELVSEMEEQRELAASRLVELENFQGKLDAKVRECEKLKIEMKQLPESVVMDSSCYCTLKSQFNLLYNEALNVRNELEKANLIIVENRQQHLRQAEIMEANELACQTQMRNEMVLLEQQNSGLKQEVENLKLELEQIIAQNEHAIPITNEMRSLIGTLQDHNKHLKSEIVRHRKKIRDLQIDSEKYRNNCRHLEEELFKIRGKVNLQQAAAAATAATTACNNGGATTEGASDKDVSSDNNKSKDVPVSESLVSNSQTKKADEVTKEPEVPVVAASTASMVSVSPVGRDDQQFQNLKMQLKKAQDRIKELTQIMETYKTITKENRDKATVVASETKLKTELEESRAEVHRLREREKRYLSDNELARKLRRVEETLHHCQTKLSTSKQEEDALLKEMEVTEVAFNDVQEQNLRLVQQLKEKDDANLKLVTERVKGERVQRILREEKDVLAEQLRILRAQVEAQNLVVRKLEEKERLHLNTIVVVEKETTLRQQALDIFKRRSAESQQTAQDLKLNLDKYLSQLIELQNAVQEKASVIEKEIFKYQRIKEDMATLKRKYDRLKKIEESSNADQVLLAEIADYKDLLTCPCCKVKRKDAILTKCFHVFCLDCLKTRYETRNRKCPKCNATFGANDYHRIYLT